MVAARRSIVNRSTVGRLSTNVVLTVDRWSIDCPHLIDGRSTVDCWQLKYTWFPSLRFMFVDHQCNGKTKQPLLCQRELFTPSKGVTIRSYLGNALRKTADNCARYHVVRVAITRKELQSLALHWMSSRVHPGRKAYTHKHSACFFSHHMMLCIYLPWKCKFYCLCVRACMRVCVWPPRENLLTFRIC